MNIQTKPKPYCPICGARMRLVRPRPDQDWKAFWSCNRYPDCKGTRSIRHDGRPEGTETWTAGPKERKK